eukprot:9122589-Alexandrium_andersonii.AAC.1
MCRASCSASRAKDRVGGLRDGGGAVLGVWARERAILFAVGALGVWARERAILRTWRARPAASRHWMSFLCIGFKRVVHR